MFLCFFFQAEDGIRDYKVTGVQTCALPISKELKTKFNNGFVKNTIADFGIVPYGHSISGTLIQAVPFNACEPLEMNKKKMDSITGNLIIIVQRDRKSVV